MKATRTITTEEMQTSEKQREKHACSFFYIKVIVHQHCQMYG